MHVFSEDKILPIYTVQKFIPPWFIMHHVSYCRMFSAVVIVESFSYPQCEKMDLKVIEQRLERGQVCKRCWKSKECAGPKYL